MIPAPFRYRRPGTLAEAVAILADDPDAKVLAGGHSLLPVLKLRLGSPTQLVDIAHLPDLLTVAADDDRVLIGAGVTHHRVATDPLIVERVPLLAHAASLVGDPQVRHRGTLGGSLAHADPAADLLAVALVLDASVVVQGPDGVRNVGIDDLFTGFLQTTLIAAEIITAVRVPAQPPGWGYRKLTRRALDWAIAGAAVRLGPAPRVALVNMAATPVRAPQVEAAVAAGGDLREATARAVAPLDTPSDGQGSADYRRHLAAVLVQRAVADARSRS